MWRVLRLLFFLFAVQIVEIRAQQSPWLNIGIEDEVPDPNITAFVKTPDGELYIGCSTGIFRYDGYHFSWIKFPPALNINPYVNSLLCDGKSIYAGVRNGVIKIDIASQEIQKITSETTTASHDLYFNSDTSLLIASNFNGLILIPVDEGLFRISDTILFQSKPNLMTNSDNSITIWHKRKFIKLNGHTRTLLKFDPEVLEAKWWNKEKCWLLLKNDGLYSYDCATDFMTKLKPSVTFGASEDQIIYSDGGKSMWIKTTKGFGQLKSRSDTAITIYTKEKGNPSTITSNTAQSFYQDEQGTVWVGGDGTGFGYLSTLASKISFISNTHSEVEHFWFFKPLAETAQLLCGTTNGVVLGNISGHGYYNLKRFKPPGYERFSVTAIADLNENEWIISVYNEGVWLLNKHSMAFSPLHFINEQLYMKFIYGMQELSNNKLALLTRSNAYILDKETMQLTQFQQHFLHHYSIYAACEDSKGNYFFGGSSGLQIFNNQSVEMDFSDINKGLAKGLTSNIVMCVKEITENNYFVATMGGGLCNYNLPRDTFNRVDLITQPVNVFGILAAGKEQLIFSTSNGLCSYDLKTGSSAMLNNSNLLPFNDFNQSAYGMDKDNVYFGGELGMLIIPRKELSALFEFSDEIVVWKETQAIEQLTLKPGENNLKLRLTLKSLLKSKKLQFIARINELDTDWHQIEAGFNLLEYNYLPPGDYNLEIRTNDPTGFVNTKPKILKLNIEPFYYQTLWFKLIVSIVFLISIVLVVRYFSFLRLKWKLNHLEADRKLMLERSRISQELHDNLGSQLTYLISGLEMTEMLLIRNELEKTTNSISKMQEAAKESMQQLRESIWVLSSGKMTLLSLAMQFEKWCKKNTENNEKISTEFDFSKMIDESIDTNIGLNLFRIMQESVHNVIKHADASRIVCQIYTSKNDVIVTIQDNGKGFKQKDSTGLGLDSMSKRAERMNARLKIQSFIGEGTRIELVIGKNKLKDE